MKGEDPAAENERLRRTVDVTNALLAAVSSPDPVQALVARMATICRGSAIVYDFEGNIVASTGEAPVQLIWNEVTATNRVELSLEIGRWEVHTRRVALRAGVHVIAIASRGTRSIVELSELLLDTSERLLSAVHGIQYGATLRDRRDNEQLMAALHDGILPSREDRFWNRTTQFGFQAYSSVRTIEALPLDDRSATAADVGRLVAQARSDGVPLLIMLHRVDMEAPATVSALLPDTAPAERLIDGLSAHYLIGASAPFISLAAVPEGVREAETALRIGQNWAAASAAPGQLGAVRMDQIDLTTWLLSHVDQRQLRERVERTLAPIGASPLRETLVAYLATGQNVARTAELFYVHPNTVRYRLSRIEEEIGMPVASAPALANLVLALHPAIIAAISTLEDPAG